MKHIKIILIIFLGIGLGCEKEESPELIESVVFTDKNIKIELTASADTIVLSKQQMQTLLEISNTGDVAVDFQINPGYWYALSESNGHLEKGESVWIGIEADDLFNTAEYIDEIIQITYSYQKKLEIPISFSLTELRVDEDKLVFAHDETEKSFNISDPYHTGKLEWQVSTPDDWIRLSHEDGIDNTKITVTIDKTGLSDGVFSGIIYIFSNGGYRQIKVFMDVGSVTVDPEVYNSISESFKTDVFIENFYDNSNNWSDEVTDEHEAIIAGGSYILKNHKTDYARAYHNKVNYQTGNNFEIETYMQIFESKGSSSGLMFRFNRDNGNVLTFNFNQDKEHFIYADIDDNSEFWQDLTQGYINTSYNKITVRKYDGRYYFFVNEELVYQRDYYYLEGDRLGFWVGPQSVININYITVKYIDFGLKKIELPISINNEGGGNVGILKMK